MFYNWTVWTPRIWLMSGKLIKSKSPWGSFWHYQKPSGVQLSYILKMAISPFIILRGGQTMSYYLTQTNQVLIITCSNPVICCLTNKQDSQLEVQTNCETMLLCITSWNIGYRLTYRPRTLNTPWKYHKSPQCGPLMKWHIPPFQKNRNYYIFYLQFSTPPILPFWYYPNLMVHGSYWGDLSHILEWYNWTI